MRSLILCSLLFLTTMPALRADDTSPAKTDAAKTDVKTTGETGAYRVSPEDVLDVTVQNHDDLSKSTVVLPDGTISYPYVGEFKASGLTLHEVSDRITAALSKEIANPQVMVTIKSLHERQPSQVSIWFNGSSGKTAGRYILKEGWRVLDLLIEAGGLPTDHSAAYTAYIMRQGSENIPVELPRILSGSDPKANIPLLSGDLLVVQQFTILPSQIQVLGDVAHTGAYALPKDGSLVPILTAAGPLPSAALSKCEITHGDTTTVVDLSGFLTQGRIPGKIKLESGDTLFIPQNKLIYSVYGAVGHQGKMPYPDNQPISALTALSNAGGQAQDANLKQVSLVHPVPGGKAEVKTINLEDAIKKGDISKDVALAPGDILFVPSHRHSGSSFGLSSLISALPFIGYFGLH